MVNYEPEIDAIVPNLHTCSRADRVVKVMANPFKVSPEDGIWERKNPRSEWTRVPEGQVPTRDQPLRSGTLKL